jgi:transcriptional regulator with XRE-family HTH domain
MKQSIGDRVKELRNQYNLSQQDLADKIKLSKSQMNRYENRGVQPPADVLNKLADVLGTTVDFLINGNKDEKAKATLKNNELLTKFKEMEALPENEQSSLLNVISAYLRDYKSRLNYKTA